MVSRWEPIVMAGFGAAIAQLDPNNLGVNALIIVIKGFIGGAVGAYFGNHVSNRKEKAASGKVEETG